MLAVTKPGGFVVLYHAENEGEKKTNWTSNCTSGISPVRAITS